MGEGFAGRQATPPQRADPLRTPSYVTRKATVPSCTAIGHLQRTLGNRGMDRLLRFGAIQAKLTVGASDDEYEREADRIADEVIRRR